MKVLVIDDDVAHGESLAALLIAKGREAYFAPDLREATWYLQLFRFELALIDWDMPYRTGPQVAVELVELDPAIKTVLMSGDERRAAERLDALDLPFVAKPIAIERLLETIDRLVGRPAAALTRRRSFPLLRQDPRPPD